jgi:hypothetical protein
MPLQSSLGIKLMKHAWMILGAGLMVAATVTGLALRQQADAARSADFAAGIPAHWPYCAPFADENANATTGFLVVDRVKECHASDCSGVHPGDIFLAWEASFPDPGDTLLDGWLSFLRWKRDPGGLCWFARDRGGTIQLFSCEAEMLFECHASPATFCLELVPRVFAPEAFRRIREAIAAAVPPPAQDGIGLLPIVPVPGKTIRFLFQAADCEEVPLPESVGNAILSLLDGIAEWPRKPATPHPDPAQGQTNGETAPGAEDCPDGDRLTVETATGNDQPAGFLFSRDAETVSVGGWLVEIPPGRREAIEALLRTHRGAWNNPSQTAMDAESRRDLLEHADAFAANAVHLVLSGNIPDEDAGIVARDLARTLLECRAILRDTSAGAEDTPGSLMGPLLRDGEAEKRIDRQMETWKRAIPGPGQDV